jgi:hypothetical protein
LVPHSNVNAPVYSLEAAHDVDVSLEFLENDLEGLAKQLLTDVLVDDGLCLLKLWKGPTSCALELESSSKVGLDNSASYSQEELLKQLQDCFCYALAVC